MKPLNNLGKFTTLVLCMLIACMAIPVNVVAKVKLVQVSILSGTSHGLTERDSEPQYQYLSCDGYVWITADANGNTQVYINDNQFSKNTADLVDTSILEGEQWKAFRIHIEGADASKASPIHVRMDGGQIGKLVLGGGKISTIDLEITGGSIDRFVFTGEVSGACNVKLKNCTITGSYGPIRDKDFSLTMNMSQLTMPIDESIRFSHPRGIFEDILPLIKEGANIDIPFKPTSGNLYEIYDSEDFYWFEALVDEGYNNIDGKLMSDIYIEKYTMIGSLENPFMGVFDGNGHKISGLNLFSFIGRTTVNDQITDYAGLFACVKGTSSKLAVIKNLTVEGEIYQSSRSTATFFIGGGVVGIANQYVEISDVISEVYIDIYTSEERVKTHVGGIVGTTEVGTQDGPLYLDRCVFKGTINQYGHDACAGIVGCMYKGHIWDCVNAGTITNVGCIENSWVSGIVGYTSNSSSSSFSMKRCLNVGQISATKDDNNYRSACYAIGRMESCPSEAFDKIYYKSGSASNVKTGSATISSSSLQAFDSNQLKSGEVAWLLNGSTSSNTTWRQDIGTDDYPTPDSRKNIVTYSNGSYSSSLSKDGDYYQIYSKRDLYKFASMVNGGQTAINARLMADIVDNVDVLDGESEFNDTPGVTRNTWSPIGTSSYKYNGTFDGQGHTVSGLYLSTSTSYVGLFGYTGTSAVIKNVILRDSYIKGQDYVGGICGCNLGTISCCANFATICGSSTSASAGGICGRNYQSNAKVENCYNAGKINATGSYASSLGEIYNSQFINCYYLEGTHTRATAQGASSTVYCCTSDQLKSGEIAYRLNGDQSSKVWRQTIGEDIYPVLNSIRKVVYRCYTDCNATTPYYANVDNGHNAQGHNYVDGFCTYCKGIQSDYAPVNNGYFEISTDKQLAWFAAYVNAGNGSVKARLKNNVSIGKNTMIGTHSSPFKGVFDGNGYKISGLNQTSGFGQYNATTEYAGLFGYVMGTSANYAVIQNLTVEGSISYSSTSGSYLVAGGIAAITDQYVKICDVVSNVNIEVKRNVKTHMGGIAGTTEIGTANGPLELDRCTYAGTLKQSGSNACGGIVGYIKNGHIHDCVNAGTITNVGNASNSWVSGLLGYVNNTTSSNFTMKRCLNVGTVSGGSACYAIGKANSCPSSTFDKLFYKSGSASATKAGSADFGSSIQSVTTAQLESGEVAYKLNGSSSSNPTWYQKLKTDSRPHFVKATGNTVYYGYTDCSHTAYANSALRTTPYSHLYANRTLTANANSKGLYSYLCDYGCGTESAGKIIKDYTSSSNLELTADAQGNLSTSEVIALTDAHQFKDVTVAFTTGQAPTYTRSLGNKWGTLVVPFDVTIDAEEPYDFYALYSVSSDVLTLQKVTGTLSAGTPVLVRMSDPALDAGTGKYELALTANSHTISTAFQTGSSANGLTLTGAYSKMVLTNANGYFIMNNAFWNIETLHAAYPTSEVSIGAFRAYLAGTLTSGASQLRIGMVWDAETETALEMLDALSSEEGWGEVYDLNGRKQDDLQPGINIVKRGGKCVKVMIK